MKQTTRWTGHALMLAGLLALGAVESRAGSVTLRSGNGTIGSTDSQITFLDGPGSSDFAPLTATDFSNAKTGPAAYIIPDYYWIGSLLSDPLAKWIGTNPGAAGGGGDTALYAINFNIASAFSSASIDFHFAVDNTLGGTNEGVFINGVALSGDTTGGGFGSQSDINRSDIASLLVVGANTLYIDAVNLGGPAGLLFSATITTTDSGSTVATPEPATIVSMAFAGVVGLGVTLRRRMVKK